MSLPNQAARSTKLDVCKPVRLVLPLGRVCVIVPLNPFSRRISHTYRQTPWSTHQYHIYSSAGSFVCVPGSRLPERGRNRGGAAAHIVSKTPQAV